MQDPLTTRSRAPRLPPRPGFLALARRHSGYTAMIPLIGTTALLLMASCSSAGRDWQAAAELDTIEAYERFLEAHPESSHGADATTRIHELAWHEAEQGATIEAYLAFLQKYPDSGFALTARERVEQLEFQSARLVNTLASYEQFLASYPDGRHAEDAQSAIERKTRFPVADFGYPDLEATGRAESCVRAGQITTLRANSDTFVSAEDLRSVFTWNGGYNANPSGPDGATVVIDDTGRTVFMGSWCWGNQFLIGPVRLGGGGILLRKGAFIGYTRVE